MDYIFKIKLNLSNIGGVQQLIVKVAQIVVFVSIVPWKRAW